MSHVTPQYHKLQLLLWQFAENPPSKSYFCVKCWTRDSWHFPDHNSLCWVQYPVWPVPAFYLRIHLFIPPFIQQMFTEYLLRAWLCDHMKHMFNNVCLLNAVLASCATDTSRQEEWYLRNTNESVWAGQPPQGLLLRHLWPFPGQPLRSQAPCGTPPTFPCPPAREGLDQFMDRLVKGPPDGSSWLPALTSLVHPVWSQPTNCPSTLFP